MFLSSLPLLLQSCDVLCLSSVCESRDLHQLFTSVSSASNSTKKNYLLNLVLQLLNIIIVLDTILLIKNIIIKIVLSNVKHCSNISWVNY